MSRRYVVFVSSTFLDLEEERELVMKGLLSANCIPAGMEHFPAADDPTFEYIKRIIDDSDYYLLILGGKYGTPASDGVSYTEKEFDYAVSKGIPVIALPHENLDKLAREKTEQAPERRAMLEQFRKKVSTGRLVKFWNSPEHLVSLVIFSLHLAIENHTRPGLVRQEIKVFDSRLEQQKYFLSRMTTANQVHDLTWATFGTRTESQSDTVESEQKRKMSLLAQRNIMYDEIFVFNDGLRTRDDRLEKLRDHYQEAISGKISNYSCAYYEAIDFPRLQYTVIDQCEILFTSGQNTRCAVYDSRLAEVFLKYFEQAWSNATILIDDGKVKSQSDIDTLLSRLT